MKLRGSSRVSSYQQGKAWAELKFRYISERTRELLIDTFSYYKSPDATCTNTGRKLTPSRKQFYYGAMNYLKEHQEQTRLFN